MMQFDLNKLDDEQLAAAYQEILHAKPQLPHYRRARMAILDLIEFRRVAVARLQAQYRKVNPIMGGS